MITERIGEHLDIREALEIISKKSLSISKASGSIQKLIEEKISKINKLHVTNCIVPVVVARILLEEPQWISLAVEAFYGRDIIGMRVI